MERSDKFSHFSTVAMLLHDCINKQFWGSVEVQFQNGKIIMVRQTQTMKPEEITRYRSCKVQISGPVGVVDSQEPNNGEKENR